MCTNSLLGWCPRLPSLPPPCSSYADVRYWSPTRLQSAGAHAEASIARQSWISIGRGWQATTDIYCSLLYFDHSVKYSSLALSQERTRLYTTQVTSNTQHHLTQITKISKQSFDSACSQETKVHFLGLAVARPSLLKISLSIVVAGQPYCASHLHYTKDHCVDQPTTQNST